MKKNNRFYVTTPIYYVNSKPHLGTVYTTLLADVTARWHKLSGQQTYFLTGLDEHGKKVGEAAEKAGMAPLAFVGSMVPPFKEVWKRYGFAYDQFIRTTDSEHVAAVQLFWQQLIDKGDVYKSSYVGYYCTPDETFIASAAVVKANPLCPECKRPVTEVSEESYFFRLSSYEEQLLAFYAQNPNFITPKERLNEIISFVKSGLKDLSISRKSVAWGIPFPGDPEHTVYVWGDALLNYITAIGYGRQESPQGGGFERWWPADLQIMAKDIVRFHAVYWPAMLMAAGLELPKRLMVHGYLLMDGQKMSKSRGNGLDPLELADEFGVDQVRYYLMRYTSTGQDCPVLLSEMRTVIAADLSNNLGNLLNRTLALALRHI